MSCSGQEVTARKNSGTGGGPLAAKHMLTYKDSGQDKQKGEKKEKSETYTTSQTFVHILSFTDFYSFLTLYIDTEDTQTMKERIKC